MASQPDQLRRTGRPRLGARLTSSEILAAIRRWNELHGEPPTMADWDPYRARQIGQEWRVGRYDAGDWPSIKSVRNHFGKLSAAVAAAGLVPRRQGQQRPQPNLALDIDTRLHLARLRAAGDERPTPLVLAAAVREVSRAHSAREPVDLHVALIQLAATALSWAGRNDAPPGRPVGAPTR